MYSCTVNRKVCCIICIFILYGSVVSGDTLTLNSVLDVCSRALSDFVFHICTGNIQVSGLPASSLSRVRSKRASLLFAKQRPRRQIVDECCLRPCTVAQLVEYCPEYW